MDHTYIWVANEVQGKIDEKRLRSKQLHNMYMYPYIYMYTYQILDQKKQKIVNGTSLDHGVHARNLVVVEPNGAKEQRW